MYNRARFHIKAAADPQDFSHHMALAHVQSLDVCKFFVTTPPSAEGYEIGIKTVVARVEWANLHVQLRALYDHYAFMMEVRNGWMSRGIAIKWSCLYIMRRYWRIIK